ncbi:MAG TPA: hypothetical protein VHF25_15745 [Nitriliruptorales bacterium]|nr:hypothetical protein [Nitriliruptorales bacterium]
MRARWLAVLLVFVAALVRQALPTQAATGTFRFSTENDRSPSIALQDATVRGVIYAFLDLSPDGVETVRFFLDGREHQTEENHPYDVGGGSVEAANPWDTARIADGAHRITAKIARTNGTIEERSVTFTVDNGDPGPTPSPSSSPSPTPTPTASPTPTPTPAPTATSSTTPTPTPAPAPPTPTPSAAPSPSCDLTITGQVSDPDGFTVPAGKVWCFDPGVTTTVETPANVVVEGTLRMRPSSPSVHHTLRFVGVTESRFVGGDSATPIASDVGAWVQGAGVLDVQGAIKTPWTRAIGSLSAGQQTVTVQDATGWRVGDEVAITPTGPPNQTDFQRRYDERRITAVSANTLTLDAPLAHHHPAVTVAPGVTYAAEVLNLTRNVHLQGTPSGDAHVIFNRVTRPQVLRSFELRHMGVGNPLHVVTGRWGLHFHMAGDASRGSLVEGAVARFSGSRTFVPHLSHGITLRGNVAHDVLHDPYWWDAQGCANSCTEDDNPPTHDSLWEANVASKVKAGSTASFQLTGFSLNRGDRNVARGNVAVGVDPEHWVNASGFKWPENSEGVWTFTDNLAHNNVPNGAWVWQVTSRTHPIARFTAYHNAFFGWDHGAYDNNYEFDHLTLYGNGTAQMLMWAVSRGDPSNAGDGLLKLVDSRLDGAGISPHALVLAGRAVAPGTPEGLIARNVFTGYTDRAVKFTFDFHDYGPNPARWRLTGNSYGPAGTGDDFRCTDDIHEQAALRSDDHALTLRRAGQAGTYRADWNCSVQ